MNNDDDNTMRHWNTGLFVCSSFWGTG